MSEYVRGYTDAINDVIAVIKSGNSFTPTVADDDKTKLFFIDDVNPTLDFDSYVTPYEVFTWGVKMSRNDLNKVILHNFNPNTTNNRSYNIGYLKAFLGQTR